MREIKFRAWDKRSSKMRRVATVSSTGRKYVNLIGGLHDRREGQNVVLMQYTGLKDKNDVEIYEGDIMRWGQEVGQVFWQWRQLTFLLKRADGTYIQPSYVDAWSENMEVIGNIYENPELLEQP